MINLLFECNNSRFSVWILNDKVKRQQIGT